jgi:hypothetical protein
MGPFHISARTLEVERSVVRECLVRNFLASRKGQTLDLEPAVIQHMA